MKTMLTIISLTLTISIVEGLLVCYLPTNEKPGMQLIVLEERGGSDSMRYVNIRKKLLKAAEAEKQRVEKVNLLNAACINDWTQQTPTLKPTSLTTGVNKQMAN